MRHRVPGSCGIYASKEGVFTHEDDTIYATPDENNKIHINLYGKDRYIDAVWLMNLAVFAIDDPLSFDYVRFYYVETKKSGWPYTVIYLRAQIYDRKRYGNKYRIVPGYTTVAVSRIGECIYTGNNTLLTQHINNTGYQTVDVWTPIRMKIGSISVHILVARAWVLNRAPCVNFVVNHLDGVKTNNRSNNLEWTTHRGNLSHAVNTGLREGVCKCRVRDIDTGEVIEIPSLSQVAKFLGMKSPSKNEVMFRSVLINKIYGGKYEVRVCDDDRPWFYDNTNIVNREAGRYIITIKDGDKTLIFNGLRRLIKYYALWNIGKTVYDLVSVLKERRPDLVIEVLDQFPNEAIQVLEVATGTVTEYPRVMDAHRATGIPRGRVVDLVRRHGIDVHSGYRVRYSSSEPWGEPNTPRYQSWGVEVKNKQTGEVKVFSSLRQVASALNTNRKVVTRCLRKARDKDLYEMRRIEMDLG